jgi:hypothetical protein
MAQVRCRLSIGAAQRYGPVPPASRVVATIAARRACGPPLTPEPLTTRRHGQGQGQALLAQHAAHTPPTKIKSLSMSRVAWNLGDDPW